MTNQEAIKEAEIQIDMYESFILYNKDFEPENDNSNYENKIDFLKTAIKALEKQIPKKPIYSNYDDNGFGEMIPYTAKCSVCRYEFEFGTWNGEENHHCVCGQAIDWSGEE